MNINPETGELLEFDELRTARNEKLDQLAEDYFASIESIGTLKAELNDLKVRISLEQGKADGIMNQMQEEMSDYDAVDTESFKLKKVKRKAVVEITDIDKVPKEFLIEKVEIKPDKINLYKFMSENYLSEINGVRLVENVKLDIKARQCTDF